MYLGLYVDDFVIPNTDRNTENFIEQKICSLASINCMGEVANFLRINPLQEAFPDQ